MSALKIKVFADGADFDQMVQLAKNPNVKGFTTNPTLMRKAGVSDYSAFARKVLDAIPDRPISELEPMLHFQKTDIQDPQ